MALCVLEVRTLDRAPSGSADLHGAAILFEDDGGLQLAALVLLLDVTPRLRVLKTSGSEPT